MGFSENTVGVLDFQFLLYSLQFAFESVWQCTDSFGRSSRMFDFLSCSVNSSAVLSF